MTTFQSDRCLFSIAAILMLLNAGAHTMGITANLDRWHKELASLDQDGQNFFWCLAFTMSITFAALGALNLVVAASDASTRLIRALLWTNFFWVAAFAILSWRLSIVPGLALGVIIELVIVAGLIIKPRSSP
ncbi:MAG TPA: hypothetical protein VKS01_00210 [Bryobacteraceae bacterium]|nr:hypothetical protein [Bryobacteraceae bacterium]